ncbi:hypothetical protein WKH57_01290 [Niallia taxi]
MKKLVKIVMAAALAFGFGFAGHKALNTEKVADQPAVEKPMADPPMGG